jgi:hypothetical protein
MFRFLLPLTIAALVATTAGAAPITISVSGQFPSSITAVPPLAAPNATFSISFVVDSNPTPSNMTSTGFDAPFSGFSYRLNGAPVGSTAQFIRFFTASDNGLFSVFFGPESGFMNGIPIPIFEFQGPQLFTGTTSAPVFGFGTVQTTGWTYSDAQNFASPSGNLPVTATPEPSSLFLSGAGLGAALFGVVRRRARAVNS